MWHTGTPACRRRARRHRIPRRRRRLLFNNPGATESAGALRRRARRLGRRRVGASAAWSRAVLLGLLRGRLAEAQKSAPSSRECGRGRSRGAAAVSSVHMRRGGHARLLTSSARNERAGLEPPAIEERLEPSLHYDRCAGCDHPSRRVGRSLTRRKSPRDQPSICKCVAAGLIACSGARTWCMRFFTSITIESFRRHRHITNNAEELALEPPPSQRALLFAPVARVPSSWCLVVRSSKISSRGTRPTSRGAPFIAVASVA